MSKYLKSSQLRQKSKTHIVCNTCGKRRLMKFYSSKQARKCRDCKIKGWRLARQSTPGKIKKKKDDILREKILVRDNRTCQWCGKENLIGRNCQMSHVYSKGAHPELRHDPLNVKILCYHCHFQKWHKDPDIAIDWFKSKFPERYKYLREKIRNE